MREGILIVYFICSLLLIDYYDGYIPSKRMVMNLFIISRFKVMLFVYLQALKRRWLLFLTAVLIAGEYVLQCPVFFQYFLFLVILSVVTPYLSYYRQFQFLRYGLYGIPVFLLYFDMEYLLYGYFIINFLILFWIYQSVDINPYEIK